ncbi:DUF6090 family protein [Maribacter sp. CXY002]|uniref:DUF6090 family protein n=1 Tax=Maribacter luteocoastalis TaxID=3407671 RepID=UPI003B67056A
MIKFFRKIRQKQFSEGRTRTYLQYAIGEILLVVIGILIALQINNWNENRKSRRTEIYVLNEIVSNLNEDANILDDMIFRRELTKASVANMSIYLQKEIIDKEILEKDMVNFLTFERYFSINNAYEILKSKGLQLSNNDLTSKISRYYDYEQNKINRSVVDIENAILKIIENDSGILKYVESIDLNNKVLITNYNNPDFKEALHRILVGFQNNNTGTLKKLKTFHELNTILRLEIEAELKSLNND